MKSPHPLFPALLVGGLSLALSSAFSQVEPGSEGAGSIPLAGQNKTVALAEILNDYEEAHLLFALMAASPFSQDRTAEELVGLVGAIQLPQKDKLKKDWFVFLLKRFSNEEIEQMRKWQLESPNGKALLLKMLAQVGMGDPNMLGQMMGIVPNNFIPQGR